MDARDVVQAVIAAVLIGLVACWLFVWLRGRARVSAQLERHIKNGEEREVVVLLIVYGDAMSKSTREAAKEWLAGRNAKTIGGGR